MTKGLCSPDGIRNPFHFQVSLAAVFPHRGGRGGGPDGAAEDGRQRAATPSALQASLCLLAWLPSPSLLLPPSYTSTPFTKVPQSPAERPPPHARSLGRAGCLFCRCPPPPLHVHPGLLEPPLAANRVSEHPPAPGSRETRPGPSPPPAAGGQARGQGVGILG